MSEPSFFKEMEEGARLLHQCRYCQWYTGSDDTGCAGRPTPCKSFGVDPITTPKQLLRFRSILEPEW